MFGVRIRVRVRVICWMRRRNFSNDLKELKTWLLLM